MLTPYLNTNVVVPKDRNGKRRDVGVLFGRFMEAFPKTRASDEGLGIFQLRKASNKENEVWKHTNRCGVQEKAEEVSIATGE